MKVAIVAGIVVEHDAISASVVGQAAILKSIPTIDSVVVFAQHISRDISCRSFEVDDAWSLAIHPEFADCDVAIFHWGIYYRLFDVLTLVASSARARPVVHFHNCTPRELVAETDRDLIDRSIAQVEHAISLGVTFWTFSEFNWGTLIDWGTPSDQIRFVPIPIELPTYKATRRRDAVVQLLTVGRRVPAKGLHVLLDALGQVPGEIRSNVHLTIAGSSTFTAPGYIASLHELIDRYDLDSLVEFVDEPTDEELWLLYCASDVVVSCSFHEGLCVPIIEGYSVGCRAIGTTAGNLPFVVQRPDPCVDPGDPHSLAEAIAAMVESVGRATERTSLHDDFVQQYSIANTRRCLQRGLYHLIAL